MSFTGFSMHTEIVGEEFEETLNRMKEIALLEKIAIGFGWVKGKSKSENHYTIVDKSGVVLEDYVKIHPFSYSGNSSVVTPNGEVLFDIEDKEELRIFELTDDVPLYRAGFPTKADRRPDLYKEFYE